LTKLNLQYKHSLKKIAITECYKYKINVVSITCDGAYPNSSTFQILGCKLNEEFSEIKLNFSVDPTKPDLYFTPDHGLR